jgi:hydroxypyruvate reductase
MARALEQHWPGSLEGVVVTRYGHAVGCEHILIIEAAHPLPDASGLAASTRVMDAVRGLQSDDLVIGLFSGGGSSLLPLPLPGITLTDKQRLGTALLASGASISEINTVRRHLSAIKGGRLAAACVPARVHSLLISDVPGDDPKDIASGPMVADPTRCADALAILERYRIDVPCAAREILASGRGESCKPGDARLARVSWELVATPAMALEAAAERARQLGVFPVMLGDALEGEARQVGADMARMLRQKRRELPQPCVLLSGGETTVTVRGTGRGGRNVEFLLAFVLALDGMPGAYALAGDTDGVDGMEEIAGAWVDPDTLARAQHLGLSPRRALEDNDAHRFFSALGQSVITGPTLTNVNDFRAILLA